MAEESLKIKIGADIVEVTTSIAEVEKQLKDLSAAAKTASGQGLLDINKQIGVLNETLVRLKNVGKDGFDQFGVAVKKFGDQAGKVIPNTIGLSQTLRDAGNFAISAQTGFLAISNNLPSVIDDFGRFRKALADSNGGTATFTQTLKGFAGSLIGPAGISIALGVAATAIPILIGKFLGAKNATNEATKAFDDFKKGVRSAAEIQAQAGASVAGEVSRINALVAVIKDETTARDQKIRALNDLKAINPTYFKDLSTEAIQTGKATDAINAYTLALKQAAIVKAFSDDIAKLTVELAKQSVPLAQLESDYKALEPNVQKGIKAATQFGNSWQNVAGQVNDAGAAFQKYTDQKKRVDELTSTIKTLNTELNKSVKAQTALPDLTKTTKATTTDQLKAILERYKKEQELIKQTAGVLSFEYLDALKRVAKAQADIDIRAALKAKDISGAETIKKLLELELQKIEDDFRRSRVIRTSLSLTLASSVIPDVEKQFPKKLKVNPNIEFSPEVKARLDEQAKALFNFQNLQEQFLATSAIITNALTPVFDGFFQNIESGKGVLKSLGDSVKRFVVDAIKQLVKLAAISAVLSFIPGAGTFSSIFKSQAQQGGGFLGSLFGAGTRGAAPNLAGVGAGGFAVNVGGQFNVRGTDLVAVVQGANQRINRVNG